MSSKYDWEDLLAEGHYHEDYAGQWASITAITSLMDAHQELISNYEQLLEDLPQGKFSDANTPPELVINEVEKLTYIKTDVQDDIKDLIEEDGTIEDLKNNLKAYFEI